MEIKEKKRIQKTGLCKVCQKYVRYYSNEKGNLTKYCIEHMPAEEIKENEIV